MRFVRFRVDATGGVAAFEGDELAHLDAVDEAFTDIASLLDPERLASARLAAERAPRIPRAEARLLAPLPRPRIVFAIGVNYRDHARETGRELPTFPIVFNKQVNCITGPFDPIEYPKAVTQLDYEGELAFVIGRRCHRVPEGRGLGCIGGYMVMNDVTARDWQARSPTMTLGKSFDTHGPTGPCVVTADEIGDPHRLEVRTWVNGELRQHSNTRELIFDCGRLVEILSTVCTLEPGDIVSTGTPSGVGIAMEPLGLLQVGDTVRIEIDEIGMIENQVVAEREEA